MENIVTKSAESATALPPAKASAEVADTGRITFGAGFRLPPAR